MDAVELSLAVGFADGVRQAFSELKDSRVVGRCDHLLRGRIGVVVLAEFRSLGNPDKI